MLTCKEILRIIEKCGESQVAELQVGDLCVSFRSQAETKVKPSTLADPSPISVTEITESQKNAEQEAIDRDELSTREDQIANAILEDPMLAEELLIRGETEQDVG